MISLFEDHLPREAADWPTPSGGMFLWVRLKVEAHPLISSLTPEVISDRVFHAMVDEKVVVAPSIYFKSPGGPTWTKEEEAGRIFMRLSFSLPSEEEMAEGVKRMGVALRREWKLDH